MLDPTYHNLLTDDTEITKLTEEILKRGYAALPHFLDADTSRRLHDLIADRSVANKKSEQLAGTVAYEIARSDTVVQLSQRIHDARVRITGEERVELTSEKQVFGLPYKDGRNGKKNEETAYHYDATYLNMLLPLVLPDERQEGGLVLFPNLRTHFPPLISKVFSRFLRHIPPLRRAYGAAHITYQVDTMYFFFGDRSFHGVDPITSGERLVMTINSHW